MLRLYILFSISLLLTTNASSAFEAEVVELKTLRSICKSRNGISCFCELSLMAYGENTPRIALKNCTRMGGWSDWSGWSTCRENRQRRRRQCDSPSPMGLHSECAGTSVETRNCTITKQVNSTIPAFVWGSWSDWNEWTDCYCSDKTKEISKRTRYCLSESCEGCSVEYRACHLKCPTIKKWSEWTGWISDGIVEQRFRAVASSKYIADVAVEVKTESRSSESVLHPWSRWDVRYGVALRYRGCGNRTEIQHQLMSTTPESCVDVQWILPIAIVSLLSGFLSQLIISSCFQQLLLLRKPQEFYKSIEYE